MYMKWKRNIIELIVEIMSCTPYFLNCTHFCSHKPFMLNRIIKKSIKNNNKFKNQFFEETLLFVFFSYKSHELDFES